MSHKINLPEPKYIKLDSPLEKLTRGLFLTAAIGLAPLAKYAHSNYSNLANQFPQVSNYIKSPEELVGAVLITGIAAIVTLYAISNNWAVQKRRKEHPEANDLAYREFFDGS